MKVIFLDVDGVLNSYARGGAANICKQPLRRLRDLVTLTEAVIVVSSSWKNEYFLRQKLTRYLGYKRLKVHSWTKDIPGGTRGDEIRYWLRHNCDVTRYVILDDMDVSQFEGDGLENYLVQCDSCDAFTEEKFMDALGVLTTTD